MLAFAKAAEWLVRSGSHRRRFFSRIVVAVTRVRIALRQRWQPSGFAGKLFFFLCFFGELALAFCEVVIGFDQGSAFLCRQCGLRRFYLFRLSPRENNFGFSLQPTPVTPKRAPDTEASATALLANQAAVRARQCDLDGGQ